MWWLLPACTAALLDLDPKTLPGDDGGPVDSASEDGGGDGTDTTDTTDTTEEPGEVETVPGAGEDDGCSPFYRQGTVPDLRLELTEAEWAGVQADYAAGTRQFRPASFTWVTDTGEVFAFPEAAVRLRGNPGFSWIGDKMQFMIAFDAWDDDGRLLGVRRLALDASWYNPSLLRDRLAYDFMRRAGVPAPCANHATLTVNGEYYGVYTNVERMDHEFLERNYGDEGATGGLWEGGTDIDANADNADAAAVAAYLADTTVAGQEARSDLEANIREWAAEAVIPQNDGYWCCNHNFYLYEHPTNGITFLPWDMDYTFDTAPWFASPSDFYRDSNYQPHLDAVRADPTWGPVWLNALEEANAAYDPTLMGEDIDAWAASIEAPFAADPHTSVSPGAHADGVARLKAFVAARHGFLSGWIDCAQGEDTDHDGDGYTACLDCDDGDPSIHPEAAETCNRRDDDCDLWTDEDADCDVCDEVAFDDGRFLICAEKSTWEEAEARCVANGGTLGKPVTTGEWYAVVFDTYWQDEAWAGVSQWWSGPKTGAACPTLVPASWATSAQPCDTELPAICRL